MEDKLTLRGGTRRVFCGGVQIGGGAQISIQSMTTTFTEDAEKTAAQTAALVSAGADIVRLAVPTLKAAMSLVEIRGRLESSGFSVPLVADIHFDYRIALAAIKAGADKIRINPGNIGKQDRVKAVADAAGAAGIPIRIGVNGGSLEEDLSLLYETEPARALAESALRNIDVVRRMGFEDIVVSIKSSDALVNTAAHKLLAAATDLPLHIGITEAGFGGAAVVKSAVGIGTLLTMGIGDTIRVSLTGDPRQEITAARHILRAVSMLPGQVTLISCPTCGRCRIDLAAICKDVAAAIDEAERERIISAAKIRRAGPYAGEEAGAFRARLERVERPITVAVMGCPVNGPGEAAHADFGMACGVFGGLYFENGVKGDMIPTDKIVETVREGIRART